MSLARLDLISRLVALALLIMAGPGLSFVASAQSVTTAAEQEEYFSKAKGFYEAGKYPQAFALLHPLALQGHPDSVFLTGLMAFHGLGRPIDYTEAAEWFLKASDLGVARARHFLGLMYRDGIGLQQNDVLALMWFKLGAREGVVLSDNEATRLQKTLINVDVARADLLAQTYLDGLDQVERPTEITLSAPEPEAALTTAPAESIAPPAPVTETAITPAPEPEPIAEVSPAPEPEPAKTVSAIPAGGNWAIQVGAFGNRGNVARMQARLSADGFVVEVSQVDIGGRDVQRVRIINIQDEITAAAIKSKIDRNYSVNSKVMRIN